MGAPIDIDRSGGRVLIGRGEAARFGLAVYRLDTLTGGSLDGTLPAPADGQR